MKRNLLSILILALLIVNIVISVIMMLSVNSASKKTASLVADIATIINMEIDGVDKTSIGAENIALSDSAVYDIAEQMTIGLKKGEDGADHYCILKVSLSMDTTNPDYGTYKETIASYQGRMKDIVFSVVGSRTKEEANADQAGMKQEILTKLQEMFGSKFIYNVSFSEILIQ